MFPFNLNHFLPQANPIIRSSIGGQLPTQGVVPPQPSRGSVRVYAAEACCRQLSEIHVITDEVTRLAAFHVAAVNFSVNPKLRLEEKALLLAKLCALAQTFSNQSFVKAWSCLINLYYSADDELKSLVHADYDRVYLRSELYGNGGFGWDKSTYRW